ncbi:MAG: terpene cyclase/mutase family protein [Planctomycetes bacterium]|nr:terpene cyclase/mutase family protein [Planctomycetota bacterium]
MCGSARQGRVQGSPRPARPLWIAFAGVILALGAGPPACPQDSTSTTRPPDTPDFVEITPAALQATERALAFLASQQSRNGSFGTQYPVAVTSLSGLAFLSHGNQPGQGRYGEQVRLAIRYLVFDCAPSRGGFITEPGQGQSRMHGHGFATLFLAEVWGMSETLDATLRDRLRVAIEGAVRTIENSQSRLGGWYYLPNKADLDEASVTVCEVAALRAARNAGFQVDKQVIDRAISYLKKSANKDGSFKYSLSMGQTRSSSALTAAAVSTLNFAGEYSLPEVQNGLKFLQKFKPGTDHNNGHQFYEDFYAAMAMFQAGGAFWEEWFPLIRDDLIKRQTKSGAWEGEYGTEYCTSLACLILQIPYRYLPILQR